MSAERVRYFDGQLLSAADLSDEQSYLLDQDRRATRALHGHGVVEGLGVSVPPDDDCVIIVAPGLAIDANGRLLSLDSTVAVEFRPGLVVLRVADEPSRPVPTMTDGDDDGDSIEHARWREVVTVTVEPHPPADGVVIAEIDEDGSLTIAPRLLSTSALQAVVARLSHRVSGGRRQAVTAPGAATVGPYSHATDADPLVFCSGQTPIDPATGALVDGDVGAQTTQCLTNLFVVLAAAGLGAEHVQRCNVYLTDMDDFVAMNEAYAAAFDPPYPARTTIGVAALPLGAQVEIDLIARRP